MTESLKISQIIESSVNSQKCYLPHKGIFTSRCRNLTNKSERDAKKQQKINVNE